MSQQFTCKCRTAVFLWVVGHAQFMPIMHLPGSSGGVDAHMRMGPGWNSMFRWQSPSSGHSLGFGISLAHTGHGQTAVYMPRMYVICMPRMYVICMPHMYAVCMPHMYAVCMPHAHAVCMPHACSSSTHVVLPDAACGHSSPCDASKLDTQVHVCLGSQVSGFLL